MIRPRKNPTMMIITETNVNSAAVIVDHISMDYKRSYQEGQEGQEGHQALSTHQLYNAHYMPV
jgi:hypothetical protein